MTHRAKRIRNKHPTRKCSTAGRTLRTCEKGSKTPMCRRAGAMLRSCRTDGLVPLDQPVQSTPPRKRVPRRDSIIPPIVRPYNLRSHSTHKHLGRGKRVIL